MNRYSKIKKEFEEVAENMPEECPECGASRFRVNGWLINTFWMVVETAETGDGSYYREIDGANPVEWCKYDAVHCDECKKLLLAGDEIDERG